MIDLEDIEVDWEPSIDLSDWVMLDLIWLLSAGVAEAFADRRAVRTAARKTGVFLHRHLSKLVARGLVEEGYGHVPRRFGHVGAHAGDLMRVAQLVRLTKLGRIEHFDHAASYRDAVQ